MCLAYSKDFVSTEKGAMPAKKADILKLWNNSKNSGFKIII